MTILIPKHWLIRAIQESRRHHEAKYQKITKSSVPNEATTVRADTLRLSQIIIKIRIKIVSIRVINYTSFHPSMVGNEKFREVIDMRGLVACAICRLERKYWWMEDMETCSSQQYWLLRADQPALTQFTKIFSYTDRALRSFNDERLVDRVGSDVGPYERKFYSIRKRRMRMLWISPIDRDRNTPWRMDEEAMWKDFYHKIVVEKEEKEKEQQENTEHEIR